MGPPRHTRDPRCSGWGLREKPTAEPEARWDQGAKPDKQSATPCVSFLRISLICAFFGLTVKMRWTEGNGAGVGIMVSVPCPETEREVTAGIGWAGQVLPGLTRIIAQRQSRALRVIASLCGASLCRRGRGMVDGLPSGAVAVEAQRWRPAAATDGRAGLHLSLSSYTHGVEPFSGRRRKDSRFFPLIPSPELKKSSC